MIAEFVIISIINLGGNEEQDRECCMAGENFNLNKNTIFIIDRCHEF